MRVTQGRCHTCQLRYVWPSSKGPLRGSYCERCGSELRQTVHYVKNKTVQLPHGPIYDQEAADGIAKKAGLFPRRRKG